MALRVQALVLALALRVQALALRVQVLALKINLGLTMVQSTFLLCFINYDNKQRG